MLKPKDLTSAYHVALHGGKLVVTYVYWDEDATHVVENHSYDLPCSERDVVAIGTMTCSYAPLSIDLSAAYGPHIPDLKATIMTTNREVWVLNGTRWELRFHRNDRRTTTKASVTRDYERVPALVGNGKEC